MFGVVALVLPPLEHHVGGDDELDAGDVLDGEVVAEADHSDDDSDEEADEPLHEDVLEDVDGVVASPVLLEELVLQNLVVEALDWRYIGADEGHLRRVVESEPVVVVAVVAAGN